MAGLDLDQDVVPMSLAEALRDFIVDNRTGNIKINIKDGRILGFHVEEIVSLKANGARSS